MTIKQTLIIVALVIMMGTSAFFYIRQEMAQSAEETPQSQTNKSATQNTLTPRKTTTKSTAPNGAADISRYIYSHIASISSLKLTADQKLSITRIAFPASTPRSGTVEFTDGTTKYTADFSYTADKAGNATLTSFTLRK